MSWIVRACAGVAALALGVLPAIGHAIEEPAYTTLRTLDGIELRDYAAYTVAEVLIPAAAEDAGNRAYNEHLAKLQAGHPAMAA